MYSLTHTMAIQCEVDCKGMAIRARVSTVGVLTTQWPVTAMGQVETQ